MELTVARDGAGIKKLLLALAPLERALGGGGIQARRPRPFIAMPC